MEALLIEATNKTPRVELNPDEGIMRITGRSMTEDHISFFEPILKWFEEYVKDPISDIKLEIHLEYFNTSTSKNLLLIFEYMTRITDQNKVVWYYHPDDEDMQEAGEDFILIMGESIELVEK